MRDDGQWEKYDNITTRILEGFFSLNLFRSLFTYKTGSSANGRHTVTLNHGPFEGDEVVLIDFNVMTETKNKTKTSRMIRRTPPLPTIRTITTTTLTTDLEKPFENAGQGI
jgi:hypothetical protein